MALSNIFREPRRELTEQAFGVVAVGGAIGCDMGVASLLLRLVTGKFTADIPNFGMAMVVAFFVMGGLYFLLDLVHEIGEAVCGAMARNGLDPRPRNRP